MPSRRLGDSTSLKVFGGWSFSETIGVEAGAVGLGRYDIAGVAQGSLGTRSERLSSVYGAVTGRMAVGQDVGLPGRLGLASGRAAAPRLAVPTSHAAGRKTSPIFGLGVDYRVSKEVALTLNCDYHGRLSEQITANLVSVSIRLFYSIDLFAARRASRSARRPPTHRFRPCDRMAARRWPGFDG